MSSSWDVTSGPWPETSFRGLEERPRSRKARRRRLHAADGRPLWARIFERLLKTGVAKNRAAVAAMTGVSRTRVTEVMKLLELPLALQDGLLEGKFGQLSEHTVRAVLKLDGEDKQREALETLATDPEIQARGRKLRPRKLRTSAAAPA